MTKDMEGRIYFLPGQFPFRAFNGWVTYFFGWCSNGLNRINWIGKASGGIKEKRVQFKCDFWIKFNLGLNQENNITLGGVIIEF